MKYITSILASVCWLAWVAEAWQNPNLSFAKNSHDTLRASISRRKLMQQSSWIALAVTIGTHPLSAAATPITALDPRATTTVRITSPQDRLGVELVNTRIRGRPVVVIQRIFAERKNLEPGLILLEFESAADAVQRVQSGPWPVELTFYNLAAGGDAFSDLGKPMVTAQDALTLAQQTDDAPTTASSAATATSAPVFSITTLQKADPKTCAIQSRRGDVLEINYEATYKLPIASGGTRDVVYDASYYRGTGQPYQMVLGSGDMLIGVDQGLYDMCPGDVRLLQIPPRLAYPRGNKLFRIPPDTPLQWKVELISIDGTVRKDNNVQTREEREGRALY
jgi:FKBP-type peptidyl-prolyl cis-trans isomerase